MTSLKHIVLFTSISVSTALTIRGFNLANPLSGTGLSDSCQNTLLTISENQEASTCLNIPGLAAILTLQGNSSAIPPLNTWLQGVCKADPCSNDTINAISTNITNGCQTDIAKQISQNTLTTIIQDVPKFYPTIRNMACLKTSSNDTLCASSTLLDVQQFLGQPLTVDSAMNAIPNVFSQGSLPANVTCTGCTLAAFDTFKADQAMLAANPAVQSSISQQCGSDFINASPPSDVVEGTGSAAATGTVAADLASNTNGARPVGAFLGVAASSMLSLVAALFVISA